MITTFNEQLWIDFDVEIAVFLENLVSWLRFNASKDNPEQRNFHEGRYWSYDSYSELAKRFPGWSGQTIRRIIRRAKDAGLILIRNFNKKKYDNTNWYSVSNKALAYFPQLHKQFSYTPDQSGSSGSDLNTPVEIDIPLVEIDRPIPEKHNSLGNNIIISDLSDNFGNCDNENLEGFGSVDSTGFKHKSDYCDNQVKKEASLSKPEQVLRNRDDSILKRTNARKDQEIVDAYHEVLPGCPKIKVIDSKLSNQLAHLRKNWHRYQKEGREFSIDSFKDYLNYIKQHYTWLIKPYTTPNGNVRCNNLRVLTREINITKIVNGEFSVNTASTY